MRAPLVPFRMADGRIVNVSRHARTRRVGHAPVIQLRMADGTVTNVVKSWGETPRLTPESWGLKVTPDAVWPMLDTVSESAGITRSDLIRLALVFAFSHDDFQAGLRRMFGELDEALFRLIGRQTISMDSVVRRLLRVVEVVDRGTRRGKCLIRLPVQEVTEE